MAKSDLLKRRVNVKKPAGAPPQIIHNNIEVRPYHRTEQDIPNWRKAIQSAESQVPRRGLLYNLYADVDLDGHVEAVTGKRRDPIKAANWQFVDKEGMPVDEINQVIDSIGFDDLLDEIINARFWGYSILEPKFWKDASEKWQMDNGLIPRLNYRPEIGIVSYDITGDKGINIREGIYAKTIMEVGKVTDLGLYMKAAPYAILKRGGIGDYAAFIQTFGSPLIDATWDGFDEAQRIKLNQALKDIGAGGTIIRPSGTTIEIKENNVSSTGDAHGSFLRTLNTEISKALLGTTETTESSKSSGYAQAETHQDQDDLKHMNDLAFCRKVLNSRFIRILQAYGFDTMGGEFIIQGEDQELTKKESFDIHSKMKNELNIPMDDDFFYDTYDVPRPKDYDAQKKAQEEAKLPEAGKEVTKVDIKGGNAAKKTTEPKSKEGDEEVKLTEKKWYIKLFEGFFGTASQDGAKMKSCGHPHTINLAESDRFNDENLIQRIWEAKGGTSFDWQLYYHTANVLILGFKKGWDKQNKIELTEAPGFMYGYDDPALLAAFEQNLFRFTGAKTLAEVQILNQLFKEATSFQEFYDNAKRQTEIFNKNWLETEYTSAVLTGEASATYHRLMAQAELFPYWKYTTAGDDHVRPEHALLEGLILPYNDPRWKKLFPPNGWNCRCYIVPRMKHEFDASQLGAMRARADRYLNSVQFKKEKAQGWGVNRAEAGQVFLANQQYTNKFPGKAAKLLNKLKASDWGLKQYSQAKKAATEEVVDYAETATNFVADLEKVGGDPVLRDYNNRPLFVDPKTLNKKGANSNLFNGLKEALKNPNEVWLNQSDLSNVLYMKYYKGKTIVAKVKLINGKMEILKNYELAENAKEINSVRRGLLIYKK